MTTFPLSEHKSYGFAWAAFRDILYSKIFQRAGFWVRRSEGRVARFWQDLDSIMSIYQTLQAPCKPASLHL